MSEKQATEGKQSVLGVISEEAKQAPKVKAPKAAPPAERFFTVGEDVSVPREVGGGSYFLRKGKTISSRGYDVERLTKLGVVLREVTPPTS